MNAAHRIVFALVGALFVAAVASSWLFTGPLSWAPGFVYILYDSAILVMIARFGAKAVSTGASPAASQQMPTVTVLIAGRNERAALPGCLEALRAQIDPPDQVIVVDDGSSDDSVAWLEREHLLRFEEDCGKSPQWPGLAVVRKPHSGKSRSLNRGLALAFGEVVITLDADTLLEPGAIAAVRRAFAADRSLTAAGGILTPMCRRTGWGRYLQFHQRFEYLRGFVGRACWAHHHALLLVSGAFAAFRRDVLVELQGFDPDSLVEDYDLIHRIHRWAYEHRVPMRVAILGEARGVTDAPAAPRAFLQQRTRWFAGFLQTLSRNRDMIANRRYGPVGMLMLPIKSMDTLQPLYGIYAFAALIVLWVTHGSLNPVVIDVLIAKYAFDLLFHFYILSLYRRWAGGSLTVKGWLASVAATLTEPFIFQNLRHLGAALGWIAFLRGRIQWAPPAPRALETRAQNVVE